MSPPPPPPPLAQCRCWPGHQFPEQGCETVSYHGSLFETATPCCAESTSTLRLRRSLSSLDEDQTVCATGRCSSPRLSGIGEWHKAAPCAKGRLGGGGNLIGWACIVPRRHSTRHPCLLLQRGRTAACFCNLPVLPNSEASAHYPGCRFEVAQASEALSHCLPACDFETISSSRSKQIVSHIKS